MAVDTTSEEEQVTSSNLNSPPLSLSNKPNKITHINNKKGTLRIYLNYY